MKKTVATYGYKIESRLVSEKSTAHRIVNYTLEF